MHLLYIIISKTRREKEKKKKNLLGALTRYKRMTIYDTKVILIYLATNYIIPAGPSSLQLAHGISVPTHSLEQKGARNRPLNTPETQA